MTEPTTLRRASLSVISGLLFFLAFPPMNWHWLGWVALWPLFVAVAGASARVALLCGLLTTVSFYGLSVYWVFTIFSTHGKLSVLAAAGVQCLLLLYLSIYRLAFCYAFAWLGRRSRDKALLAAPFLWAAMEWVFVRTPHFSLPWNLLGYSATEQPGVLQLASLTGVYGISFLMACFSALLALTWRNPGSLYLRPANALLLLMIAAIAVAEIGAAFWLPAGNAAHTARLVQPNLDMSGPENSKGNRQAELDEMERLSAAGTAASRLLIWPEVPRAFYLQDAEFAARAHRIARANGGRFLLGVIDWGPEGPPGRLGEAPRLRPRNSAALLGPIGERIYAYDKIHLVPFGEYVPLRAWFRFADSLVAEVGGFVPGSQRTIGQLPEGKFATLICFEAVFPGEVREFVAGGAELLVNISNDGWLGPTGGPVQHMLMARMRAVENRRWLLRATNNGLTVSVDPYGRVVTQVPRDTAAALDVPFGYRRDMTLYARFGDWFPMLCLLVSGFLCFTRGASKQ